MEVAGERGKGQSKHMHMLLTNKERHLLLQLVVEVCA